MVKIGISGGNYADWEIDGEDGHGLCCGEVCEVAQETIDRWRKVIAEYAQVQIEMFNATKGMPSYGESEDVGDCLGCASQWWIGKDCPVCGTLVEGD